MALVECKECKQNVSTEALTCPHCGVSNPSGSESVDLFYTFIAIVVGGPIAYFLLDQIFPWIDKLFQK
jgi:hypothetical protein